MRTMHGSVQNCMGAKRTAPAYAKNENVLPEVAPDHVLPNMAPPFSTLDMQCSTKLLIKYIDSELNFTQQG